MDTAGRLLRLKEEIAGLLQNRRYLLERLSGLDENISSKQRLVEALEVEATREGKDRPQLSGPRYGGLRAAILERLAEEPDGMTGVGVGLMLRHRFGDTINPRSHHAVLRRLSQDGLVVQEGRRWRLPGPNDRATSQ